MEMLSIATVSADRKRLIGVLIARTRRKTVLSPFFAKSDGLLLIDPVTHARDFQRNPERTTEATCDLILASGATRLVCGFIAGPERDRLRVQGIDVRIASCARSIDTLVRGFETLPSA